MIVRRVRQIDLLVRHIKVSAGDNGLFLIQFCQVIRIELVPRLPVLQSLQAVARVRRIYIDKIEIAGVKDQKPSLVIHRVRRSDPGNDLLRLHSLPAEDHRSGISLSGGRL